MSGQTTTATRPWSGNPNKPNAAHVAARMSGSGVPTATSLRMKVICSNASDVNSSTSRNGSLGAKT